MLALVNFLISY